MQREGAGPRRGGSEAPGGGGRAGPRPRLGDAAALRLPAQHCHMPETQTPGEKEQPPRGGGGRQNLGWSRARSWPPPPRARAHTKPLQRYLLPSPLGQPPVSPSSLPCRQPELRGRVIDGSS